MKNLKFKALVILMFWIAAVFLGLGFVRILVEQFGPEGVINGIVGAILAGLLYQVYGLILVKLEWDAKLNEMSKADKK